MNKQDAACISSLHHNYSQLFFSALLQTLMWSRQAIKGATGCIVRQTRYLIQLHLPQIDVMHALPTQPLGNCMCGYLEGRWSVVLCVKRPVSEKHTRHGLNTIVTSRLTSVRKERKLYIRKKKKRFVGTDL